MTTCFIFAEQLDEDQCLSLRLDQRGKVDAPLGLRPIHEVRALQVNARTIVVLPTDSSSLHKLELTWLPERKARAAIPYALEEQVAQHVTTLHFSFDRQYYQNSRYLIVVTDKQILVDLIAKLDALNLNFNLVTLDWFALKENEACVTDKGLLVHDQLFQGALSEELANLYLNNPDKSAQLLMFKDSAPALQSPSATIVDSLFSVWIAKRLLKVPLINLCQGDLQHDTRQHTSKQWYRACAIMAGVLLASVFLFKGLYLHALNTHITELDKKIAVIYREFFPEAQQVISPKFRIDQLLKGSLANNESAPLWHLLNKLAQALDSTQFTIEQFRFQNQVLSVTLVSKNFAALEELQQRLQREKVKVTQSQASSHEHQVMATLELSL